MKKSYLAMLLLLAASMQTALAQKMVVELSDGGVVKYNVSKVNQVTFEEAINCEAVDLALPSGTRWAAFNVGATKPEEYGDFFAWGEVLPKTAYEWTNYKFGNGFENALTKYCTLRQYGLNEFTDGLTELLPEDDAATYNWDESWQTPTEDQLHELGNSKYTTLTWKTVNGVNGLEVRSKFNDNSIFLPATGGSDGTYEGSYGYYWSRSLYGGNSRGAYQMYLNNSTLATNSILRCYGRVVRPVQVEKADPIAVASIELSETRLNLVRGTTARLTANVLPLNARHQTVLWSTNNMDVATVDRSGNVTARGKGICTITCKATDGSGVQATCEVRVMDTQPEYVDLALPSATLWAAFNVGASTPEEYGDYFAWGETLPKEEYNWSTYIYCDGTSSTMTKYNNTDGLKELLPDDDAATVNWGNGWQLPSLDQIEELSDDFYTTTEWTTLNGIYGRKVTSNINGNSIFLPAGGYWDYTTHKYEGTNGYCTSRTLYNSINRQASMLLHNSNMDSYSNERYWGLNARPVCKKAEGQGLVESMEFAFREYTVSCGKEKSFTYSVTILPRDATNRNVTWESSDNSVATVSSNGVVTGVSLGTSIITCHSTDGSGVYAMCRVKVIGKGMIDGYEAIDFNLSSGTIWATCNIGASTPEGIGNYYAWGETSPKASYDRDNYKFKNSTKYRLNGVWGSNELDPEDDAASVNWGEGWQIPSRAQFLELCERATSIEWVTQNGVDGMLVTYGRESSALSIFLPVTGHYEGTTLVNGDLYGQYWGRYLHNLDEGSAAFCGFYYSSHYIGQSGWSFDSTGQERWKGLPVRPVRRQ